MRLLLIYRKKPVLNAYRASKPVGYGMLARMYLYMGDYKKALENAVISLQNNSTLMSLFPYKVVDRDKYIGRIDVPDGDENPENIYIRLAPWTFGFSATAYASEELALCMIRKRISVICCILRNI